MNVGICTIMDDSVRFEEIAKQIRFDSLRLTLKTGKMGAHIGGALSMAEIMSVLYMGIVRIDPKNPVDENRDRVILSKGHGALAFYSALNNAGLIKANELDTFKSNEGCVFAHPSMNPAMGIEFSGGSLGQGLSLGVGTCLGLARKNNRDSRVFVILGDGECNEGSVWEAAEAAAHYKLSNLTVIVDRNSLQYDGPTNEIMNDEPFEDKWRAFGWDAETVDGHDVGTIYSSLSKKHEKPNAVIALTVKGKGVSFMENNPVWHNHSLTEDQYKQALCEIGVEL